MEKPNNKITVEHLQNKVTTFAQKSEDLQERIMDNHVEKDLASRCKSALEKQRDNQKLTAEEQNVIQDAKMAFSDVLPENTTNSIEQDIAEMNNFLDYLNEQIESNTILWKSSSKIHELAQESLKIAKAKLERSTVLLESNPQVESSSQATEGSINQPGQDKPSKSPSDYIDDFPSSHNPFDDIGVD